MLRCRNSKTSWNGRYKTSSRCGQACKGVSCIGGCLVSCMILPGFGHTDVTRMSWCYLRSKLNGHNKEAKLTCTSSVSQARDCSSTRKSFKLRPLQIKWHVNALSSMVLLQGMSTRTAYRHPKIAEKHYPYTSSWVMKMAPQTSIRFSPAVCISCCATSAPTTTATSSSSASFPPGRTYWWRVPFERSAQGNTNPAGGTPF